MGMTSQSRVKRHRLLLRAQGLRPIQIWVADSRSPGFADACRRQSLLLANDAKEAVELAWLEEAADRSGWQ